MKKVVLFAMALVSMLPNIAVAHSNPALSDFMSFKELLHLWTSHELFATSWGLVIVASAGITVVIVSMLLAVRYNRNKKDPVDEAT